MSGSETELETGSSCVKWGQPREEVSLSLAQEAAEGRLKASSCDLRAETEWDMATGKHCTAMQSAASGLPHPEQRLCCRATHRRHPSVTLIKLRGVLISTPQGIFLLPFQMACRVPDAAL